MDRGTPSPIRGDTCRSPLPERPALEQGGKSAILLMRLDIGRPSMSDLKLNLKGEKVEQDAKVEKVKASELLKWETPKMEDVSEQVMAQPYIRFT
jgi:hypothetical protein